MRHLMILVAICMMFSATHASAQNVAKDLDWVAKWGSLDLTSPNDPIIPADRHSVKRDTKAAVLGCKPSPQDPNYSKLKLSEIDIDGDGLMDVMVDPIGYFGNLDQLPTCPVHICREDGCNIHVYINAGDTQIIEGTASKDNACPASAEANTSCRKECSATEKQCPALFNHVRNVAWTGWAFGGSFINVADYNVMREANKNAMPNKTYIYLPALNNNPIFKITRDRSYCNLEEMDANHDGVVSSSEGCVKYMQYTHDKSVCSSSDGCFVDLYHPTVIVNANDQDARYIEDLLVAGTENDVLQTIPQVHASGVARNFFDKNKAVAGRGATIIDGVDIKGQGFKLASHHALASQVPNFDVNAGLQSCKDVSYDEEVCEYGRAPVGETSSANADCHIVHKTKQVCSGAQPDPQFVCNEYYNRSAKDIFIPAESDVEYQSFIHAASNGNLPDVTMKSCDKKFTPWVGTTSCAGIVLACDEIRTISAERNCLRSTSSQASCDECASAADTQPIPGFADHQCYFSRVCKGEACPPAGTFCVAADTKVLMADGSEKAISEINVGDKVKAFDSKHPTKALIDAKVKAVMITGEKTVISLNDLKITSVHKVILEGGKTVEAKAVKIGDKIIKADGKTEIVKEITEKTTPVTVYNMDVEGADGYIAGGLRVLDYPVPDKK